MSAPGRPDGQEQPDAPHEVAPVTRAAGDRSPWLTFAVARVGEQHIGIDSASVARAVRRPERLTSLPRRSGAIEGLLPFDGRMVPVVRLHEWLASQVAPAAPTGEERVLVLQEGRQLIGIPVDAVTGTRRVRADELLRVHHDDDGDELFQSALPGSALSPALCLLEPQRLMRLAGAWCAAAEIDSSADIAGEPADAADESAVESEGYATFRIGDTRIGLRAVDIAELMPTPPLRSLLPTGGGSRGICHWRGRVIPIVDLAEALHARPDANPAACVCMVRHGDLTLGVMVNQVLEMTRVKTASLRPADAASVLRGVVVSAQSALHLIDGARLMQRFPESALSLPDPEGRLDAADGIDQLASSAYMMFDAGASFVSPIRAVQEVIGMPEPVQARIDAGLPVSMDWRDEIVPVVDLRRSLARPSSASPRQLVVLARGEPRVAVAIDVVKELIPRRTATRSKLASFEMLTIASGEQRASYEVLDLAKFLTPDKAR